MLKSKLSFAYFFILASLFLCQTFAVAQSVDIERGENSALITFQSDVDSAETVTSDWFSVKDIIPYSLYTYPVNYTKIQSSTLRVPKITVTIEGSNDQTNVVIVDTIGTVGDSLETLYNGNVNFNDKKFMYYRYKYTATGTHPFDNATDAVLRTDLLFTGPKK